MKKRILVVLIVLLVGSSALWADVNLVNINSDFGYSGDFGAFSAGVSTSFAYYVSLNQTVGAGFAMNAVIPFVFTQNMLCDATGFITGPSLYIQANPKLSFTLTAGFAMYMDESFILDNYEFMSLGGGIDFNINFVPFGNGVGFSIGTTHYITAGDFTKGQFDLTYSFFAYFGFVFKTGSLESDDTSVSYIY